MRYRDIRQHKQPGNVAKLLHAIEWAVSENNVDKERVLVRRYEKRYGQLENRRQVLLLQPIEGGAY